ncbi:MAG TPA: translation initiation factor IF-2, partial [Myxococcaceae bacterium]|nr:translation initiation factor IF-2 [Myxococcaceae bacterium]
KRVHEIAKELKAFGIDLDNKEVVTELAALGYDVKSHSSSLEDDQATSAVQRIVEKRKPRAAPPPAAAKGFVVRRRAPGTEVPHTNGHQPEPAAPAHEPEPPQAVHSPEPVPAPEPAAPEPQTRPAAPAAPEPVAMASVPEPAHVQAAPEEEAAPPSPAPEAPAAPESTAPVPHPPAAAQPAAGARPPLRGSAPGFRPAQIISKPPAQGMRPGAAPGVRSGSGPAGMRPGGVPPRGPASQAGMQGRAGPASSRPGVQARPGGVPPRPGPGGRPGAPAGSGAQSPGGPPADPRSMRPTATQAVVISRPSVPFRRVTPSSTAHKNIPVAPGRKAIGEVREFKVVPDHLGRGREFVDVTKKKDDTQRGKKRATERDGTQVKQEMDSLLWGRVQIPVRGKKKKPTKKGQKTQITEMAEEKKVIRLEEGISVSDLGQRMGVKTTEIIRKLMAGGTMATANQLVDADTAGIIAADYGWKIEKVGFEVEDHLPEVTERPEDERPRPPVVTVMGHVDHGKTSLLDAIRKANVAEGEAGGITQHIGAYSVATPKGDITFLDTPGHEAFTAMRARGANVTDLVILVVAADDGVMPQTLEAISHAKAAKVPIVVAINKIDLAGANPERVKKDLAAQELVPEEWGGDTIMVPVSARTKEGIDLLLENVALQAEVLELTANPNRPAVGAIIEAKLEKGRGPVATVLVREGTLRTGDAIVSGIHYGRLRAMKDGRGQPVKEVTPGYPAEVVGLSGVPTAGDVLNVVEDEKAAKEIADHRALKERQVELGKNVKESLETLLQRARTGEAKELRLVLKGDVQGSVEAVAQAVTKLAGPKVGVDIIHKGVGAMTESDVMLAAASKGIVVGFNVKPESGAEAAAKAQGVGIYTYTIIYELIDGVKAAMTGLLEPIRTEKKLGRAEVRNTFNVPRLGTIAGVAVLDGVIRRGSQVRILREAKQVGVGKVTSLKRFKDDVREVEKGFECGVGVEGFTDFKNLDVIEAFEIEETRPSLF